MSVKSTSYACEGGLNTSDSHMALKPGAMVGCLNYEVSNEGGYRRVDGFERYDGRDRPSDAESGITTTNYSAFSSDVEETHTGDGSNVTFTIGFDASHSDEVEVFVDGVLQSAYTVDTSADTITFSSAPANGADILISRVAYQDAILLEAVDRRNSITPVGGLESHGKVNGTFVYSDNVFAWRNNAGDSPTVTVTAGGSGYTTATVTIGGSLQRKVTVTNSGYAYTSNPTVTIGAPDITAGRQATAVAIISNKRVVDIRFTDYGNGYTSAPTITISGGGGTGATATCLIRTTFSATPTITAGAIASISATGTNIGDETLGEQDTLPVVQITGDGTGATATVSSTGQDTKNELWVGSSTGWNKVEFAKTVAFKTGDRYLDKTISLKGVAAGGTSGSASTWTGEFAYQVIDDGSVQDGDAEGTLYIASHSGGTPTLNEQVFGYINSTWTKVADVKTTGITAVTDVSASAVSSDSSSVYASVTSGKFEHKNFNFSDVLDKDAWYIVNGVDRAMEMRLTEVTASQHGNSGWIAGYQFIEAREEVEDDIPTHVAKHGESLFLGYSDGVVSYSTTFEPTSFLIWNYRGEFDPDTGSAGTPALNSLTDKTKNDYLIVNPTGAVSSPHASYDFGSTELVMGDQVYYDGTSWIHYNRAKGSKVAGNSDVFGIGDEFVGFINLSKERLAVLGRSSIYILSGGTPGDYSLELYNSEGGALEWSSTRLLDGFYMGDQGLTTIKYESDTSDFAFNILSYGIQDTINSLKGKLVDALPIQNKDHYRLFFNDGQILTTTMQSMSGAQFMGWSLSKYADNYDVPYVATCSSNGTISNVERAFMGDSEGWLFEIDQGTSFDGNKIPAYVKFPFHSYRSPTINKRFRKSWIELKGRSPIEFLCSNEYSWGSDEYAQGWSRNIASPLAGADYWNVGKWNSFYWGGQAYPTLEVDIDGIGYNMSMFLYTNSEIDDSHSLMSFTTHFSPRGRLK